MDSYLPARARAPSLSNICVSTAKPSAFKGLLCPQAQDLLGMPALTSWSSDVRDHAHSFLSGAWSLFVRDMFEWDRKVAD